MRRRVLVVHESHGPFPAVRDVCAAKAFDATLVEGYASIVQHAITVMPALILFDAEAWRGPVEDALCRLGELKVTRPIRKVILADRGDLDDKVDALEAGADDFLLKPISIREIVARMEAVLRSSLCQNVEEEAVQVLGDLSLYREGMEVSRDARRIRLSPIEYHLLSYFMNQTGNVLSREELLENVWFPHSEIVDRRVVDVYVWRLREKIEEVPSEPRRLITKRGGGYLMTACSFGK